jgi:hypothetical protein
VRTGHRVYNALTLVILHANITQSKCLLNSYNRWVSRWPSIAHLISPNSNLLVRSSTTHPLSIRTPVQGEHLILVAR